jgi:ferritin
MDAKLFQALNDQINEEAYSAYLYLGISTWLEAQHFPGFAQWMKVQAAEESKHAFKLMEYLQDRGEQPVLKAIKAPKAQWKSVLETFEESLKHEKHISACYGALMDQAHKAKDYASIQFLGWFVTEQVEEEKSTDDWVQKLRMAGESKGTLLHLDHQAGKRA